MECSWNDGGKTQYYIVILDQLQGHSRGLVWAPESYVKGSLTSLRHCCYSSLSLFVSSLFLIMVN